MKLQGKRVAILVEDDYEALEVWYPDLCLREAGAEVTIVGPQARSYKSTHGLPVQAQVSADRVRADDFEMIVIPSGFAAEAIGHQPAMLALIDTAIHQGKLLAMIVRRARSLAATPDKRKKDIAKFFGKPQKMRTFKAEDRDEDRSVIRQRNLIKARTPVDLPAFCRMIIAALSGPPPLPAANIDQG